MKACTPFAMKVKAQSSFSAPEMFCCLQSKTFWYGSEHDPRAQITGVLNSGMKLN